MPSAWLRRERAEPEEAPAPQDRYRAPGLAAVQLPLHLLLHLRPVRRRHRFQHRPLLRRSVSAVWLRKSCSGDYILVVNAGGCSSSSYRGCHHGFGTGGGTAAAESTSGVVICRWCSRARATRGTHGQVDCGAVRQSPLLLHVAIGRPLQCCDRRLHVRHCPRLSLKRVRPWVAARQGAPSACRAARVGATPDT